MRPRIKICCISSVEEAQLAIKHGADALGLVGPMPSGPGVLSIQSISEISITIPSPIASFFLTSEVTSEGIIEQYRKVNTSTIQLVDKVDANQYPIIKQELPKVELIQVIHVLNETSIEEAIEVSQHVDAILLDSGNPNLKVKELGGTGKTHNWNLSRQIVEAVSVPVFLAGGIKVENVREAIETVNPFGIDLCSGVRTNDTLDEQKLKAFFEALNC